MARILPFAKGRVERKRDERQTAGEIVIFPGVRVEYHDDPPPEPQAKGRQRRRHRNSSKDALSA